MKIDIFNHILPKPYFDTMTNMSEGGAYMMKRVSAIPMLYDVDARFEKIDQFGDDYKQVFSLNLPPVEVVAGPEDSPELAQIANDGMAEVVSQHPDRFPGFVAALPMNNTQATLDEIDRSINKLGAKGVQIFTNVNGRPLDDPELAPVFDKMAELDLPIWLHPTRSAEFSDYVTEDRSWYDMWWAFGWPYETSVAMGRIVMSGPVRQVPGHQDHHTPPRRLGAVLRGARRARPRPAGAPQRRPARGGHARAAGEASVRLLPHVLRGHGDVRLSPGDGVRAGVLRG